MDGSARYSHESNLALSSEQSLYNDVEDTDISSTQQVIFDCTRRGLNHAEKRVAASRLVVFNCIDIVLRPTCTFHCLLTNLSALYFSANFPSDCFASDPGPNDNDRNMVRQVLKQFASPSIRGLSTMLFSEISVADRNIFLATLRLVGPLLANLFRGDRFYLREFLICDKKNGI